MKTEISVDNPIQFQIKKYKDFSKYILSSTVKPNILWKNLEEIPSRDTSILYLKTSTIYQEDFERICKIISTIMKRSSLFIRILTSSILIFDLAHMLAKYKKRILYSLPIVSPVNERLLILQQLQLRNFQTYGMLLPQRASTICDLLHAIDPIKCESIWVESPVKYEREFFQEIVKEYYRKEVFKRIRFFVCTRELSIEDDQYFKMFPSNIIFYD